MINKFKALDNIGLISYLHKLVLAIRQFFATKSEMDVVATALTDLDNRKIEASDIPTSLPADGGNADTLDNFHASSFYENGYVMFKHTIDASGLDTNTWYPVIMPIDASNTVRIEVRVSLNSYTKPSWSTHSKYGFSVRKIWEVNGSGWGINQINRRILESDYSFASTDPVRGIGQLGNSSTEYVYVRGGGKYYFYTSHNVPCTLCTTTYTIYSQSVEPTTTTPENININVGYYCSNAGNASNADYATSAGSVDWSGVTNKPVIGNGRLILKNGNTIISDNFTANTGNDTIIDLNHNSTFTNKSDFELLGSKVDKIDTSITKLNNAMQVDNPIDDSDEGDEETTESNNEPFTNKMGTITLNFWTKVKYIDLPVYDVFVLPLATVKESMGTLSYYCEIFLVIDITGYSIADDVGFTQDSYRNFFIRGANVNNEVCGFDIRGNGNTNTANACITGNYLHLQCSLKLHGGDSGTGNDIMQKAANEQFNAYLCLRQTP